MLHAPLSLSLSPCNGERVAGGRERGSPANPPIIIGNRYELPGILHSAFPSSVAALRRVDCHLPSLRLALGWLSGAYRLAINTLSGGSDVALMWLWVASPPVSAFCILHTAFSFGWLAAGLHKHSQY